MIIVETDVGVEGARKGKGEVKGEDVLMYENDTFGTNSDNYKTQKSSQFEVLGKSINGLSSSLL